jgi:hypothetical protein
MLISLNKTSEMISKIKTEGVFNEENEMCTLMFYLNMAQGIVKSKSLVS